MFRPRRASAPPNAPPDKPLEKPVVLSWLAQANRQEDQRQRGSFEVLVRHLFARLLSSASLDASDDANASWAAQAAYAAALPTLLYALYLIPAYHPPVGKPPQWAQVSHHFFYVDFSFAIMGLATVLQWDLLFPDALDALILTHLPISGTRLLLGRVAALAIFLGGILLETSCLGILFFPAVADLPNIGGWHFAVHTAAVLAAGLCAIFSIIALQGVVICCLGQRLAQALSPFLQAFCVLFFTMLLVLEPLLSHLLPLLLASPSSMLHWFPPFWFLGLYEHLLAGPLAAPMFGSLARTGLLSTAIAILLALVTYPLAHARKTRQAIEGGSAASHPASGLRPLGRLLDRTLLHDGRSRAVFHWISQTLGRTQRTRLLLAFFAALVLAVPVAAWMLKLTPAGDADAALLSQLTCFAVPAAAFFTVIGLRTALRAPVAQSGSWLFRVIHGRAKAAYGIGTETWVAGSACIVTLLITLVVHQATPFDARHNWSIADQLLIGILLSVLLTDFFFLRETAAPFTALRASSVNDLSITVVMYFVLFPVLAFALVAVEPWFELSRVRFSSMVIAAALVHAGLRRLKTHFNDTAAKREDMEQEALLPGEIGLRS